MNECAVLNRHRIAVTEPGRVFRSALPVLFLFIHKPQNSVTSGRGHSDNNGLILRPSTKWRLAPFEGRLVISHKQKRLRKISHLRTREDRAHALNKRGPSLLVGAVLASPCNWDRPLQDAAA